MNKSSFSTRHTDLEEPVLCKFHTGLFSEEAFSVLEPLHLIMSCSTSSQFSIVLTVDEKDFIINDGDFIRHFRDSIDKDYTENINEIYVDDNGEICYSVYKHGMTNRDVPLKTARSCIRRALHAFLILLYQYVKDFNKKFEIQYTVVPRLTFVPRDPGKMRKKSGDIKDEYNLYFVKKTYCLTLNNVISCIKHLFNRKVDEEFVGKPCNMMQAVVISALKTEFKEILLDLIELTKQDEDLPFFYDFAYAIDYVAWPEMKERVRKFLSNKDMFVEDVSEFTSTFLYILNSAM